MAGASRTPPPPPFGKASFDPALGLQPDGDGQALGRPPPPLKEGGNLSPCPEQGEPGQMALPKRTDRG